MRISKFYLTNTYSGSISYLDRDEWLKQTENISGIFEVDDIICVFLPTFGNEAFWTFNCDWFE